MTIQVIGSKPGAYILDKIDVNIFVNGAVHLLNSKIDLCAFGFTGQNIFKNNLSQTQQIVFDSYKDKILNRLILIDFNYENFTDNEIKQIPCQFNDLVIIKRSNKIIIEKSYTQNNIMFWINLFKVPEISIYSKIKYLREYSHTKEIKLSTGIFSVLYAAEHYKNAKIIISGIGFGQSEYWWGKENKPRGHYLNDYAFLLTLSKNHELWKRLYTTEQELHDKFNIPLYESHIN